MPRKDTKFKPGQSGNPKGRPKGSGHKLSEVFIGALCEDFNEHGVAAIRELREKDTTAYARVIASVVPKNVDVTGSIHQTIEHRAVSEADERIREMLAGRESTDTPETLPH